MPGASLDHDNKVFTVSQSWLGTFLTCPARAGFELRGESTSRSSDATELGSAWHEYIEDRTNGIDIEGARAKAHNYLETAEFEFVKIKTMKTLHIYLDVLIDTFEQDIHPQLGADSEAKVEHSFDVPLTETSIDAFNWEIRLKGTIDRIDPIYGLMDWKTAGRTGQGSVWDKSGIRFKIQADAYTYAMQADEFTYVVATKGPNRKPVEWHTVSKGPADWAWLKEIGKNALECALADVWALNHTHHLCSAKWCDAWTVCKGKTIEQAVTL